ncbi:phosphoadenylyl-sulfate reductase [Sphingomonas cavernae]|uniref:Adenosine 5'-phosphosulfate reductase n=1 Tax=Sphingomonas cavernae TaxID=2320861 RepID=A0A418W5R1_9SPHN|nr:phosphoadenylyl-sulfate reductase [Sphingomonas cavernae]RJF85385.1 phosphoadenylyl-sulfate reductase [Sphingomonas cavernae]
MNQPLRKIDFIDARPRFTEADAIALNNRFRGTDTVEMLRTLFEENSLGRMAVVSSFGTESAVLLHLIASADPTVPVLFGDTLKMFPETLDYRDTLTELLGLTNVITYRPDPETLARKDDKELRWSYDPDGCCEIRKVIPLERELANFDVSISGRKGFQSSTRKGLPRFEIDGDRLKINPLADWTKEDLEAYFEAHDLPRHPLEEEGYPSIGCQPCTSKVKPGEDPRAGRWRGWDKVECGIHTPIADPDDPANQPVF